MNETSHELETEAWTDPIVAEVRVVREALLAECGYDLDELCRRLRDQQQASGRTVISLPPRKVVTSCNEAA